MLRLGSFPVQGERERRGGAWSGRTRGRTHGLRYVAGRLFQQTG